MIRAMVCPAKVKMEDSSRGGERALASERCGQQHRPTCSLAAYIQYIHGRIFSGIL
jgi:hypothetical protein